MARMFNIILGASLALALAAAPSALAGDNAYDQDAELIKSASPVMPSAAEASGYCCVKFNVLTSGQTANVRHSYCTNHLFAKSAENAVSQWLYNPAKAKGAAVMRRGMSTQITFVLAESNGTIIPGRTGFMRALIAPKDIPPPPDIKGPEDYEAFRAWQDTYYDIDKPCGDFTS